MPCQPCNVKRVFMYLARGMTLLEAVKRTIKIMPLIEKAVKPNEKHGNPSDYFTVCTVTGTCACDHVVECISAPICRRNINCGCTCPPPILHAHLESKTCEFSAMTGCTCLYNECGGVCACKCGGWCYFNCDSGYVWNPVTLLCELVAVVPKAGLHPSKILPLILNE